MSATHLLHLAQLIANDGHAATFQSLAQYRSALLKEIAQASAAPEQEAVAPIKIEVRDGCVYLRSGPLDPGEYKLYPHADPSEVERLRAECLRHEESAGFWGKCSARTQQKLEIAEQKLAEAQALLRICSAPVRAQISRLEKESKRSNHPHLYREEAGKLTQALRDLDAFLSATAQPAECQHRYMYFGTQPARRCADCNKVEPADGVKS